MTTVIPEGYAEVVHSLLYTGDTELMACTYGIADGSLGGTPQQIADECHTAFGHFVDSLAAIISLVQTEITYQQDPLPAPPVIAVNNTVVVGTNAGACIPQNSAWLVHKRTATGGRGGRGRFYYPGVREGDVDSIGVLDSTQRAYFQTQLDGFLTELEASAHVAGMVILHDSAGAFAAADPVPVTSLNVDIRIATQRRRLRH